MKDEQLGFDFGEGFTIQPKNLTIEKGKFSPQTQYVEVADDLSFTIKGHNPENSKSALERLLSKSVDDLMKLPRTRREAVKKKSIKYYTGKPCSKGHMTTRLTSTNWCDACRCLRRLEQAQKQKESARTKNLRAERKRQMLSGSTTDNRCESNPPLLSRKDALKNRMKFYYTGKRCIRGHLSQRYTIANGCVKCQREDDQRRLNVSIVKVGETLAVAKYEVDGP